MSKINNINISGPINIVRVEGSINGIDKVLYLFFDWHVKETKCSDYRSIDIVQLFDKFTNEAINFKNEWDLFIEDDVNYVYNKSLVEKTNYVSIYILELRNFFNNKYSESVNELVKKKDNIRYHYFDLRMKLNYFNIHDFLEDVINYKYAKSILYNKLENIYNLILVDYDYIFKKENKINKKYNNSNLCNIILNILDNINEEFKKLIQDFKEIMNDVKKESDNNYKKITKEGFYDYYNEIGNKITNFHIMYRKINSNIIDLYFLRRFLDKKYIKNSVIYSGADHSINIIHKLVKLFDFKITNVSYNKTKVDKLNKFIKKSKDYTDLRSRLYPEYLIQCSSMEGFPDMFL